MVRITLKSLALLALIGGLVTSVYYFSKLSQDYTVFGNNSVLINETGNVGEFIGGVVGTVFSLAGFLVLVLTLNDQNRSNQKERFENKFFDLLKLHRENVKEMGDNDSNGRKQLHDIYMQVLQCKEDLIPIFSGKSVEDVYTEDYLTQVKESLKHTNENINLGDLAKINLSYLITFYGVGAANKQIISHILKGRYKDSIVDRALDFISMKPIESSKFYSKWQSVMNLTGKRKRIRTFTLIRRLRNNENIDDHREKELVKKAKDNNYSSKYIKYYGGHQYMLGHYFRHLYQTFKFIDQQKIINGKEKYFYAKTLRAQLSTHEQGLLFLNSLSVLGLVWDLAPDIKRYKVDPFFKSRLESKRLITKYNLIKNLPGEGVFGIVFREFYPNVHFEHSKL